LRIACSGSDIKYSERVSPTGRTLVRELAERKYSGDLSGAHALASRELFDEFHMEQKGCRQD